MYRLPAESTATPQGASNSALVAGPLSPLKPARPVSRHGGDHSVRDLADAVVTGVGDVQVAGGIHGDAVGIIQLGAGGRAAVAADSLDPVSRHGGDHPIRDLADAAVTGVGDVQVAGGIHGDAGGIVQLGAGGRTVVADGVERPFPPRC